MSDLFEEVRDPLRARTSLSKEAEEVRHYVLTKPMHRPRTTWVTPAAILLGYALVCSAGTWMLVALTVLEGIARGGCIALVWILGFCVIARLTCIKLVECYQHYASEDRRRRCLCMPTCSEYALVVLKKKPLPLSLLKIRKRLFKTCRDGNYQKDFP